MRVLAAGLLAAGVACRPAAFESGAIHLRAAYTSSVDVGDLPSLMAHRALSHHGRSVTPTFFAQPELAVAALAAGDADVASGGVRAFWAADARGADLVLLMEHSENGYVLVTVPDIGRCADLDGRTLALSSRGSLPAALGEHFLAQCPDATPRILTMPHSGDRLAALRAHATDAAILQRADVARLQRDFPGQFVVLDGFRKTYPDLDFEGVFTTRRFARAHRPVLVDYVRQRILANRQALDDPDCLIAEAAGWPTFGPLDNDVVAGEVQAPAWTRDGGITHTSVAATLDFFVRAGSLPAGLSLPQIVDFSILDDALAGLEPGDLEEGGEGAASGHRVHTTRLAGREGP